MKNNKRECILSKHPIKRLDPFFYISIVSVKMLKRKKNNKQINIYKSYKLCVLT